MRFNKIYLLFKTKYFIWDILKHTYYFLALYVGWRRVWWHGATVLTGAWTSAGLLL